MESAMEDHKPFCQYVTNPALEAMGITAYVGLAQALEKLGDSLPGETPLDTSETVQILDGIAMALTWMQATGIVKRHPDLGVMPFEVQPSDFKTDEAGLVEWLSDETLNFKVAQDFLVTSLFN